MNKPATLRGKLSQWASMLEAYARGEPEAYLSNVTIAEHLRFLLDSLPDVPASALLEVGEEGRGERITLYRLKGEEEVGGKKVRDHWRSADDSMQEIFAESEHYEVREALLLPTETRAEEGRTQEAICDTCGAGKGKQAIGESCNNNCGGKVVGCTCFEDVIGHPPGRIENPDCLVHEENEGEGANRTCGEGPAVEASAPAKPSSGGSLTLKERWLKEADEREKHNTPESLAACDALRRCARELWDEQDEAHLPFHTLPDRDEEGR